MFVTVLLFGNSFLYMGGIDQTGKYAKKTSLLQELEKSTKLTSTLSRDTTLHCFQCNLAQ